VRRAAARPHPPRRVGLRSSTRTRSPHTANATSTLLCAPARAWRYACNACSQLAHRVNVAVTELFDTPWVVNATRDPAYQAYALATRHRGGRPALLGPTVHTIDEFLEAVLSEEAIGLAPASAARYYPRPGISFVPVPDADPSMRTLSWRADRGVTPAAQALVDLVCSTLPLPRSSR
jgi:LysR substrate binding domain